MSRDERGLGDDADRMTGALQHLQYRAHDAPFAFDGLVGVRIGADGHARRLIARVGQFLLEQLRGIGARIELGLEIEPCRVAEEAMRRAGKAVDATVLAAAIRIDRAVERNIGTVIARDDGARRVVEHRRLEGIEIAEPFPAIIEGLAPLSLEAARVIGVGAAPAPTFAVDCAARSCLDRRDISLPLMHVGSPQLGVRETLKRHAEQIKNNHLPRGTCSNCSC